MVRIVKDLVVIEYTGIIVNLIFAYWHNFGNQLIFCPSSITAHDAPITYDSRKISRKIFCIVSPPYKILSKLSVKSCLFQTLK